MDPYLEHLSDLYCKEVKALTLLPKTLCNIIVFQAHIKCDELLNRQCRYCFTQGCDLCSILCIFCEEWHCISCNVVCDICNRNTCGECVYNCNQCNSKIYDDCNIKRCNICLLKLCANCVCHCVFCNRVMCEECGAVGYDDDICEQCTKRQKIH